MADKRKRNFWYMRATKTQISLRMRAVDQSLRVCMKNLCILAIQNAPSDDSDYAQAGLNLRCARILESRFSDFEAQLRYDAQRTKKAICGQPRP